MGDHIGGSPDELNPLAMMDLTVMSLRVQAKDAIEAWRIASTALCEVARIANDISIADEAAREKVVELAMHKAQESIDVMMGRAS